MREVASGRQRKLENGHSLVASSRRGFSSFQCFLNDFDLKRKSLDHEHGLYRL